MESSGINHSSASENVTIAAYYYPGFHRHPKFDLHKKEGFNEWELILNAKPRFAGHEQPRLPLWGPEQESLPTAMEKKIDAAADHGLDVFIFDWYYHDTGPFLEGALDQGFLHAKNNQRIKFCLMWANHDWFDIQGYNPADGEPRLFFPGKVTPQTWETITDLVIERYFKRENYWRIDGKPYFSIYEMSAFLDSFGSVAAAREALDQFRQKAQMAGLGGLHLNAILWGTPNLPGGKTPADWPKLCEELRIDSLTGYTWVHHGALNYATFPVSQYSEGKAVYLKFLEEALEKYPVPYFPNVTIGWDNSPRAHPDVCWDKPAPHVINPVMLGNTPEAFGEALMEIKDRLLKSATHPKIITLNAWNEWPEGSMLEPDQKYGFGYLRPCGRSSKNKKIALPNKSSMSILGVSIPDSIGNELRAFDQTVRREIPALLRHYQAATNSGGVCYVDQPGRPRRIRPWCDAVEIGVAFGVVPEALSVHEWISALRGFQDSTTGLVPEHIPDDRQLNPPAAVRPELEDRYSTMIVNYALEGLGSSLKHPITNAEEIGPDLLVQTLDSLPWTNGAWHAGGWVDCYASSLYCNKKYFGLGRGIDGLFTWLNSHVDPKSGLWGQWRKEDRWLHPVNGFYRLTRGTYAQFGRPLPYPEKAIDTILVHAADPEFFAEGRGHACNVLDVVHPLWLCLRQTDHRRSEAQKWILDRLPQILTRWQSQRGMAFDPLAEGPPGQPGLQGTEMWLSISYLMATTLRLADHHSYRPIGVHRLLPALA